MKNLIVFLLISFSTLHAIDNVSNKKISEECKKAFELNDKQAIQKSGCCSWHGGVCGCGSNGRVICCDNTYSPSCTCKESNPLPENFKNKS